MSVKSERRAWYAANVEAKPAGEVAGSPVYMEWVARANAYMVKVCKPGTTELLEPVASVATVAPVEDPEIARLRAALTGEVEDPKVARASLTDATDRQEYDSLVDAMRYRIADAMGWPGEYWDDFFRPQRFGVDARHRPDLEFCKGPLHVAWPHLTEEMQRLHDDGVWKWVTFSDYKAGKVAEREAMREAYESAELAESEEVAESAAGWGVAF